MNAPAGRIVLEPGVEKTTAIQINSSHAIRGANASLYVNEVQRTKDAKDDIYPPIFKPSQMGVPPNTVTISDLHLTANAHITGEKLYTLPLYAIISFPQQLNPIGPNVNTPNQTITLNLPITVDPVTMDGRFGSFWATYGGVVSFIGGGFAAGFAS